MSTFCLDDHEIPDSPALVAEMPAGISSKEALLGELDQRLKFPEYFGGNWDALWECIRDLSWLPDGPVVLRHHDVPLAGDVAGQKKYLSILRDAVGNKWRVAGRQRHQLVVMFPVENQDQVAWLLRSIDRDESQSA